MLASASPLRPAFIVTVVRPLAAFTVPTVLLLAVFIVVVAVPIAVPIEAIEVRADGVALVGLGVVAGTKSNGDLQMAVRIHEAAARCVVSGCDLEGRVAVYGDGELCDCVVHDVTYGLAGIYADGEHGPGTLTLRRTVVERCARGGVDAINKAVVTVMEGVVVRECKGGDFYESSGGTIVRQ